MPGRPPAIRIDLNSPVPHYRQIVDALRALLVEGRPAPGDRLPSVRRLALDLGITFNTVAHAYRLLADEGWLDLQHGRCAAVLDRRGPPGPGPARLAGFRRRLREMAAQMQAEGWSAGRIAAELRLAAGKLEA